MPESLTVSAIGYRPAGIMIGPDSPDTVAVTLALTGVSLSDIVVSTSASLVRSGASEWEVDGSAISTLPSAGEPDAFRVLRVVPAISFTSVLSGRPLIRGIDADDAGFVIDGHEAINLYHIGRFFSAFPALGAGRLRVAAQPAGLEIGRTTSGRIEIDGTEWAEHSRSQIQYGLGAWSGLTGWRGDGHTGVVTFRTVEGSLAGIADDGTDVGLSITDGYGRLELGQRGQVRLTGFHSSDKVEDRSPEDGAPGGRAALEWGNTILGITATPTDGPKGKLVFRAAFSEHHELGTGIPARSTSTSVDNMVRRASIRADATLPILSSGTAIDAGLEFGERRVHNLLAPDDPDRIPAASLDMKSAEVGGYLGVVTPFMQGHIRAGARIDAFNGASIVQPRLTYATPIGTNWWLSVGVGRAGRLLHLVSDARSEPRVAYYDLWLPSGDTVAPARVDHLAAELGWQSDRSAVRGGIFAAKGTGQLEFVPDLPDAGSTELIRAGALRVRGFEMEARSITADGRWLGMASYTVQWSERDWGHGWVPWNGDRRHTFRASGVYRPNPATTVSATLDAGSSQPYTPFIRIDSTDNGYHDVYGMENSRRGLPGARLDLAIERRMFGPWGTELGLGFSITNLAIGDQSPREGSRRFIPDVPGGPVLGAIPSSRPLFTLPPIPSVLLRIRF
ncbi:MAG TPA: hypothetical protein PLL69_00210 [Gemmatimonadales bacterium]|nr:hypothetical protein [Gemmatimonadales bacterium]